MNSDRYLQRGVSSGKEDVHAAIAGLDKGIVPGAFCKILPDLTSHNPNEALIIHADGSGTKSALAYLYWKETGDLSVWEGIAQDALVMNTDDVACAGAVQDMVVSSTIGRNKKLIPGEVIKALIQGTEKFLEEMRNQGISIWSGGGETADLGDLIRTVVVDSTLMCRIPRNEIIDNHQICSDLVVISFASFGKANYEQQYNSGIGSNGLTAARHEIFAPEYRMLYPETIEPTTPENLVYCGNWKVTDKVPDHSLNMGQMVLSPTRTYLPLIAKIFSECRPIIKGMIHNSGGGQTKCLHFLQDVKVIKNKLKKAPFLFQEIQKLSSTPSKEMYKTFNMGYRLETYVEEKYASTIIEISKSFGIEAHISGHTESYSGKALDIILPSQETLSFG